MTDPIAVPECDCPVRDGVALHHFPSCATRQPPPDPIAARSCDHCDNAREIAELHATVERQALEIAELRAMLQTANQANGRLAELAYKYKWQVRDTCTRAERAEAERDALRAALRQIYFLDHNEREWESVQEVKLFAERAAIDAAREKP